MENKPYYEQFPAWPPPSWSPSSARDDAQVVQEAGEDGAGGLEGLLELSSGNVRSLCNEATSHLEQLLTDFELQPVSVETFDAELANVIPLQLAPWFQRKDETHFLVSAPSGDEGSTGGRAWSWGERSWNLLYCLTLPDQLTIIPNGVKVEDIIAAFEWTRRGFWNELHAERRQDLETFDGLFGKQQQRVSIHHPAPTAVPQIPRITFTFEGLGEKFEALQVLLREPPSEQIWEQVCQLFPDGEAGVGEVIFLQERFRGWPDSIARAIPQA